MPLYEYGCSSCGHRFDKLESFEASPGPCPKCSNTTSRALSAPSFQLRGGGWAADGYGSSPARMSSSSPISTRNIPVVTQDGGLSSADGTRLINPDGTTATG